MRMKKLLTLLLTAVIGCLPMWAAAGTDTYTSATSGGIQVKTMLNGGKLPDSTTGAEYTTQKLLVYTASGGFYFSQQTGLNKAVEVTAPAKSEDGKDCVIKEISFVRSDGNSEFEIWGATNADYTDAVKLTTLTLTGQSGSVISYEFTENYSYFRLIALQTSQYKKIKSMSFTWEEAPVVATPCDKPEVTYEYGNMLFPGNTVTLTSPTEGSTMEYQWGLNTIEGTPSFTSEPLTSEGQTATITVTGAEPDMTFWVKATAKCEGYEPSEELSDQMKVISNVLAAPTFSHESGDIEKGTWIYITRPRYATTIHYTTDGVNYQTSTSYEVSQEVTENMTITAYATGDAPFQKSPEVTREYTVVTPKTPIPTLSETTGILPGTTLYLNAEGMDDTLTYSWGIKNGDENVVESGELTATEYADFKVPSDIEVGYTLWVKATATREGYDPSEPLDFTYTFEEVKLDAPTFSLPTSEDLMPGTEVTITMPSHATTLHYTLNDGDEQTSDANVTLTIKENTEVKAWATGTGIFTQSDEATASYKVLGKNVDVLVPTMWSDFTAGAYQFAEHGTATSSKTGSEIEYVFNGGYDIVDGVNTFYFNDYYTSILYNKTGKKILRIKLETPSAKTVYMYLSDVAPVTVYNSSPTFGFYDASDYGVWKDAQEAKSGAQYFGIWGSVGQVSRILIEYEDTSVGVEGIASENGEAMYFDLNGAKVNSLENAVPGVYVRVANGKATKVLVK